MTGGLPAGVSDSPFEAEHLGRPVWRLDDPEAAGQAARAAGALGVGLIVARTDPDADLGAFGFRPVERLLTYEGALEPGPMPDGVRLAAPADGAACAAIAANGFRYDRWHADPRIPGAAADAFKRAWVENDVAGRADAALVAEGAEGALAGFNLILRREGALVIDLIAVSPAMRGQGVGGRLIAAMGALPELPPGAVGRAGTQADNAPSRALYEGAGWRVVDERRTWHWTAENLRRDLAR